MSEDAFARAALDAAKEVLAPPLRIARSASLLYQVTVDNRLQLTVDPRAPKRGQSAFQTDLCVFEDVEPDVSIPRVVLELKTDISTHDVITYSSKARRHKHVYPYLRYGLVIGSRDNIPGKFFTHNEGLDFCVAAAAYRANRLHELLVTLLQREVKASRYLEDIVEGKRVHMFRLAVDLED